MTTRRILLTRAAAAVAAVTGLAFSSGAFTTAEMTREFEIGVASDDEAQLSIQPQGVDSPAISLEKENGREILKIDGDSLPSSGTATIGSFDTIDQAESLQTEAFAITNENEIGDDDEGAAELDITIGLGKGAPSIEVSLAVAPATNPGEPGDDEAEFDDEDEDPIEVIKEGEQETIESVDFGDQVVGGFVIDSGELDSDQDETDLTLTITAERSDTA